MKFTIAWSWMGKTHGYCKLAPDLFCVSMNGLSKISPDCRFQSWLDGSIRPSTMREVPLHEGLNMLSIMSCSNVLSQHVVQTSLGGYQSVDELCFQVVESITDLSTKPSMIFQAQPLSQRLVSISSLRLIAHVPWMMMSNLF